MARQRVINPTAGNACVQEAEEIVVLSPKTLTIEGSLEDLHNKFDKMMENFEVLNQRMAEQSTLPRIEANIC